MIGFRASTTLAWALLVCAGAHCESLDSLIQQFETRLDSEPKVASVAALKRDFPADYQRAVAAIKTHLPAQQSDSDGKAAGAVFSDYFIKAIDAVFVRDADEMAHAELAFLDRYEAAIVATLEGLQKTSARSCVDYAVDSAIGDDPTSPADDLAIQKTVAARLDAVANGKAKKIDRPEPQEAAVNALIKGFVAQGETPEAYDRLDKAKDIAASELAGQCKAYVTVHRALLALAVEPRTNLLANEYIPVYYGRR